MRPRTTRLLGAVLVLSSALSIGAVRVSNSQHGAVEHCNDSPFPFLTRLRDTAIELIFGRPPARASRPASRFRETLAARYGSEVVLRFNITTVEDEEAFSSASARLFLDVWAFTKDYVDVRLYKDSVGSLLGLLPESLRGSYSTLIPDLAAAVYETYPSSYSGKDQSVLRADGSANLGPSLAEGDNVFFSDYQPLAVISQWMRLLEAMFPTFVRMTSIGVSYEGRDIPALRLGLPSTARSTNPRKTLVVMGGLHAREWISTTTVNYIAWSFITSYGQVPMITKFLDKFDVVFIPVMNPDGFEYTWQTDRLWRKSRQHTNLRFCRGLDLDHAFGYEWDGFRPENDPCSESYGGDEPFQAVEALKLADWARNETQNNVQFVGLVDLHSYSQQILYPFTYSCETDPPNLENLQELAAGLAKTIRLRNGELYSVASACEGVAARARGEKGGRSARIESGGGSAIDWFYHELHARYSYQIKLRDTGSYGFLLPRQSIVPTGEEMFGAMKYLGDYLLGNNGIEKSWGSEDTADQTVRDAADAIDEVPELRRLRKR